jgi:hypothetical protein
MHPIVVVISVAGDTTKEGPEWCCDGVSGSPQLDYRRIAVVVEALTRRAVSDVFVQGKCDGAVTWSAFQVEVWMPKEATATVDALERHPVQVRPR